MILEGLSDGLPVNLRQLLAINSPNNPTEWLITATKMIKIQKSDENQINPSHSATQNLKTNSVSGNQWQPRNFRPHNFTPRQNLVCLALVCLAYDWVQTCLFELSAGQLPSPNPAPPNFGPPKEENQH
ncbi:hypothetical protein AVEN_16273-1 [Araneus ventricosus]|uniref:Uncharacterized protein n=1 Tax=Araneus ventricosus TaxID=182803 RepID=A0A4Y2GU94_ARAVE|nr:hypothetical protein AVEN_16273-1 [Araneus ventricosus]